MVESTSGSQTPRSTKKDRPILRIMGTLCRNRKHYSSADLHRSGPGARAAPISRRSASARHGGSAVSIRLSNADFGNVRHHFPSQPSRPLRIPPIFVIPRDWDLFAVRTRGCGGRHRGMPAEARHVAQRPARPVRDMTSLRTGTVKALSQRPRAVSKRDAGRDTNTTGAGSADTACLQPLRQFVLIAELSEPASRSGAEGKARCSGARAFDLHRRDVAAGRRRTALPGAGGMRPGFQHRCNARERYRISRSCGRAQSADAY